VSLSDALQAVATEYERTSGVRVTLNLASSNTLARQIVEGAAVDVFISADRPQMAVVESAGRIERGSAIDLLSNQLVIVVPAESRLAIQAPRDLLSPTVRRIALGDPAAVPAGTYAKQYLDSLGLWPSLSRRIVPAASVRAALAAVESGDVDAAIVYATDAGIARRSRIAFRVPPRDGPSIVYPVAAIAGARHREEAVRFIDYLRSAPAQATFRRYGFLPPGRVTR
jgi:molybdate transport system substrate-binding protein